MNDLKQNGLRLENTIPELMESSFERDYAVKDQKCIIDGEEFGQIGFIRPILTSYFNNEIVRARAEEALSQTFANFRVNQPILERIQKDYPDAALQANQEAGWTPEVIISDKGNTIKCQYQYQILDYGRLSANMNPASLGTITVDVVYNPVTNLAHIKLSDLNLV